jgi:hypothetical protein
MVNNDPVIYQFTLTGYLSGGEAEWLTRRTNYTSTLRIADRVGSNHVRGKPLFPWAIIFK